MKMISTSRMVPNCPNMDRRSGSRNRNGMFDTCSRFGCAFDSAMAVAAATAAATLCACCCCWAATWLASCWAVLSTVPVPAAVVVMAELVAAEVAQAVDNRPGLLLLLLAIEELTADGSAGEVVLLLVMTLLLLLALETCVSGSVCCNNSVILTVCCSIPFEAMALAAEAEAPELAAPPPVALVAPEPTDPGLLLAELTASDEDAAAIEDAMAAAEAAAARDVATDDGTTPNTDAGELY